MSEKRRDHKGRLLRNGESQRKDGKYEYKYIDANRESTMKVLIDVDPIDD